MSKSPISFKIAATVPGGRARAGTISTPHGEIQTPAFIPVGTKATVKGLTPEQLKATGAQAFLGNTYHLYLQPGHQVVAAGGGLGEFSKWKGPTFTDSGGFQVFSLGVAFGRSIRKVTKDTDEELLLPAGEMARGDGRNVSAEFKPAIVGEDGVTFRSHLDGSAHMFTPEKSVEIQNALGADIIFAFDECPAPNESRHYLREALDRTHRWAKRSLVAHRDSISAGKQGIYGVVQGGRHEDLRRESARKIAEMGFDGIGVGGAFARKDLDSVASWVADELPPELPRHMLGIGEPPDLLAAIEKGYDTFDCVSPARLARTGYAYTKEGRISLRGGSARDEHHPIEANCDCAPCKAGFTRSYIAHLFRADEMLGPILLTQHNLRFSVRLVEEARQAIIDGQFPRYRAEALKNWREPGN